MATFGLEILKKACESEVKNNYDRIVVIIHCALLQKKFRCLGVGDSKTLDKDETSSELLPDGWNAESPKSYSLRYIKDGRLFLAKICLSSDDMLFDLISTPDLKVKSVLIPANDVQSIDENKILAKVADEALTPDVLPVAAVPAQASGRPKFPDGGDPLRVPDRSFFPERGNPLRGPDRSFFPEVGRADLDPFFATGPTPGMLFPGPESRRNRGRGPRFDPIVPFPMRGEPDPDEFFPPGGGW